MSNLVPFSNGRCEGANPSSHVTELPDFRILKTIFVDQLCCFKLGISIPNLRTCAPGDRSHPYRKDRWRLHFIFVVFQVVAGNRFDKDNQEIQSKFDFEQMPRINDHDFEKHMDDKTIPLEIKRLIDQESKQILPH